MTRTPCLSAAAMLLLLLAGPPPVFAQPERPSPGAAPGASFLVGDPTGRPLVGEELDRRTEQVASQLRCPVCQGLSIRDSPATMAVNMKHQVRELLAKGHSDEQVLEFFESSYGEFVRLAPAAEGVTWLVWLAPVGVLFAGAWIVWRMFRRRGPEKEIGEKAAVSVEDRVGGSIPGRDELPEDQALARYVLEVRRLAYGWPEGRFPALSASVSAAETPGETG